MDKEPKQEEATVNKDNSVKTLLIVGLILTLIAGAAGWFLSLWVSQEIRQTSGASKDSSIAIPASKIMADTHTVVLPPLVTNMASPEKAWIRVEIALIVKSGETISSTEVANISSDFLAFLRQITIDQVKGPSGLMHLRSDLFDRAKIRSGDKISNILISNLVIEQ
ncbi:hypothetical protein H704_01024 [Bartonella bacilliformis Peru38]|uniref:Flagellar protein FliL n=2 Tax=Bartonella bacilliformis TaxID=774 RepID=A1UTU2_BARBK|nr:flagellar basal body-associated FliL family protein [Bartonella bacilliformis]ABM45378.1 flagellar basal body-associated protein FliL [Bartonella bacilliformis KC583]AMG86142.1 flagellar basal body protein FliL [Bartonella bacilliformis]EKS43033.1 flagellar basal body-associated protein FliL [Bartonella bacilliformis INS]EYS88627.1 hypothetical protein X472_01178 [Bartonella bacilliformis San Pedro600-02]EYS94395.1 hypothetical protein X470_01099 [Bartonella bacilliformis Peru-18]